MDQFVVVPSPKGDRFVELSRSKMGRVFRKQLLKYGDLLYPDAPGGKVKIDEDFADQLIANFSAGVADIVQVPKVGDKNEHTENPDRNIGEVIGLEKDKKGIYSLIDVRTDDADKMGKTLIGASAMMHLNYTDTSTGKKVGPTLLHAAITNRPYITNLDGFEEIVAASNSGADMSNQVLVLTPANDEETQMTLEEMLAALKADHGIDVATLQEQATSSVALSNTIKEQLVGSGLLTLSNSDESVTQETLVAAIVDAGSKIVELSGTIDTLTAQSAQTAAESEVDKLVRTGFIFPKNRDSMVKLRLSNREIFDGILPENPIVKLSNESGSDVGDESPKDVIDAEIDRLAAVVAASTTSTSVSS